MIYSVVDTRNERGELREIHGDSCHVELHRGGEHWFVLTVDDGVRRVMLTIGTPEHYRRKVNVCILSDTLTESPNG